MEDFIVTVFLFILVGAVALGYVIGMSITSGDYFNLKQRCGGKVVLIEKSNAIDFKCITVK